MLNILFIDKRGLEWVALFNELAIKNCSETSNSTGAVYCQFQCLDV